MADELRRAYDLLRGVPGPRAEAVRWFNWLAPEVALCGDWLGCHHPLAAGPTVHVYPIGHNLDGSKRYDVLEQGQKAYGAAQYESLEHAMDAAEALIMGRVARG